jgi:dynein heavy chain
MHNFPEEVIILRSLLNVTEPKFTSTDNLLFASITGDLFPGFSVPLSSHDVLMNALMETCSESNLQCEANFLEKCIQLSDTMQVRHGLMCVGQAFSGKSVVIDTLAKSYGKIKHDEYLAVQLYKLNPKSITTDQLYGVLDADTKLWYDGVAAILIRECTQKSNSEKKWIVFDGPVDAIWIENMNTVLDDNKKLCLTSGEIIKINEFINIIFEV